MNNIIIEKYVSEPNNELIPHHLILPPTQKQSDIPYKGLLELEANKGAVEIYMWSPYEIFKGEKKNFTDIFKDFILNSVLTTHEAI